MFARIMTLPPELRPPHADRDEPAEVLARVVRLAEGLSGMLRLHSLIDILTQEVKATFGPLPFGLIVLDQQGLVESASGDTSHPALAPVLGEAMQSGTSCRGRHHGLTALAVPLLGRRTLLGGLGLVLDREPIESDLGTLEGFAAIATVAFEGARLLAAADDRRRDWEDAADAISLALCIVDRGGRIRRSNRAFAELAGLPIPSVVGRPWQELLAAEWREGITQALTDPSGEAVELRRGARSIAVTAFPGADPAAGRTVLLFEDQTDRRRLQDRLVQSEKLTAIGELIAGVAHDLNNPLTSVVGFADFLAESTEIPPRIREPLRVIQQEAERASKIVKNLLSFARQSASLRPILEATAGLFRNQLSADLVNLEAEIDPDLPDLDLNPNQIQQVFVNLIQNAAHAIVAAHRPGTIHLRARRWMDGVAVDVADDGVGMTAEIAGHVFEPFFTTKPENQGTGLGLSISQGIIREHGGRITLTTELGKGSTFTIELPGRVRGAPLPPEPVSENAERSIRVLVVDDEPHILHYIRATLEAWGHTVTTAADGLEGLERAVAEPFDLIISDLRMPRAGGREFYAELERRAPDAARRVAFSTGDTVRGDTLAFLEAQHRPCLQKPFSLAELRTLIRAVARA
jgi:two-component system NtrC family sensor kinase